MKDSRTETELVEAARQDETEAFEELVNRNAGKIYNLCYRYSGREDEARDLTQETFVRAFKAVKKFHGDAGFSSWLYRIASNIWFDRAKRRKKVTFVSMDMPVRQDDGETERQFRDGGATPEQDYEKKEMDGKVQEALCLLAGDQRTAIILKYIEGKSLEEIASICGCSFGTASSRISRGLKELRKHLKGYLPRENGT